jgi:uncharacterized membrane protein
MFDVKLYSGAFINDSTLSAIYTFYLNIFVDISLIVQIFSIVIYFAFNKLFRKELFKIIFSLLPCKISPNTLNLENSVTNESQNKFKTQK